MVNQMRRALGHATSPAARAEAAPLARKGHQAVGTAAGASEARKPVRKYTAAAEALKLTFDE
jgi:hypothetical protein